MQQIGEVHGALTSRAQSRDRGETAALESRSYIINLLWGFINLCCDVLRHLFLMSYGICF